MPNDTQLDISTLESWLWECACKIRDDVIRIIAGLHGDPKATDIDKDFELWDEYCTGLYR